MSRLIGYLCCLAIIFLLVSCGGGGDSDPTVDTVPAVTPTVVIENSPIFKLNDAETLVFYNELVEFANPRIQVDSLHPSELHDADVEDVINVAVKSNALALDAQGKTLLPIDNFEPVILSHVLMAEPYSEAYLFLSRSTISPDRAELLPGLDFYLTDEDGSTVYVRHLPVIGPSGIETEIPLSGAEIKQRYGEQTAIKMSSEGPNCSQSRDNCTYYLSVQALKAEGGSSEIARYDLAPLISEIEQANYMLCSLIKLQRQTGEFECVGGTQKVPGVIDFFGQSVPIELDVALLDFLPPDSFIWYEEIRNGLESLQLSGKNELYVVAKDYDYNADHTDRWDYSSYSIVKVNADNLADFIHSDVFYVGTMVVFPNGEIVTPYVTDSSRLGLQWLTDAGEVLYLNNSYPDLDAFGFYADTGSTMIYDNFLINRENYKGFNRVSMERFGVYNADSRFFITDEGAWFVCDGSGYISSIYDPNGPRQFSHESSSSCSFGLMADGFRVSSEYKFVEGRRSTEVLRVHRFVDGLVKEVWLPGASEGDFYKITSFGFGNKKIVFNASKLVPDAGLVMGEVDVEALFENKPELEYLRLWDISAEVEAKNSIKELMSIPNVIEPSSVKPPRVLRVSTALSHTSSSLAYIAVEFSEYMDQQSVLENVSLWDSDDNNIDYIPVWLHKNLLLIPVSEVLEADSLHELYLDAAQVKSRAGLSMSESDNPNNQHRFN